MGFFLSRLCPKCSNVLEFCKYKQLEIGNPFQICPYCGARIKLDHIKEWDDFGVLGKIWVILANVVAGLAYGFAVGVALFGLLTRACSGAQQPIILVGSIVVGLITFGLAAMYLLNMIMRSRRRIQQNEVRYDNISETTFLRMGGEH